MRFGVASDVGHRGLAIQEGVGLYGGGIVDQNLIDGGRLGRLIVACAEEGERFGVGICEDSAAIWSDADARLAAAGRHGVVLVEVDPLALVLHSDSFVASGIRLTLLGPGDAAELRTGAVTRGGDTAVSEALLAKLVDQLARHVGAHKGDARMEPGAYGLRGVKLRVLTDDQGRTVVDLECPRDDA